MLAALVTVQLVLLVIIAAWLWHKLKGQSEPIDRLIGSLEEKHRIMLSDLHKGLTDQGDRLNKILADTSERLRNTISEELKSTRDSMKALELAQTNNLSETREKLVKQLADFTTATQKTLTEQGRADQELIQATMRHATQQLTITIEGLTKTTDTRLEQISSKVAERLDEGFKKTNETFVNVMARLATIDEAQKKIDGLTTNVVSLQELLGDKRSRGAFGEVQLENLIRNILPQQAYDMQHVLSNGSRADCVIFLPEPLGMLAIDSKFPLENYHRMFAPDVSEIERAQAQRQFKADVKKHVDDISQKYIIPNETCDGAVMFVPAEAVFAEIHSYHSDVGAYAHQKRVWIVSPTTMMAIITTTCAVMKDIETRKQAHIIKDALGKLAKEFERFDSRMKKLADHIRQAHEDAEDVHNTSKKISQGFLKIERVELEHSEPPVLDILNSEEVGEP